MIKQQPLWNILFILVSFLLLLSVFLFAEKVCPKCGRHYTDTDNFCAYCENEDGSAVKLIKVQQKQKPVITADIIATRDSIKITSVPESVAVYLNGGFEGKTPLTISHSIIPGTNKIRLTHPGYKDFVKTIKIEPAENEIVVAQDGSGDYKDIQDAINAAYPGFIITIKPGDYYTNGPLLLKSGITIIGCGLKAEIYCKSTDDRVIEGTNISKVILRELVLCHRPRGEPCYGEVLAFSKAKQCRITNCILFGCGTTGVSLSECENIIVDSCGIASNSYNGVEIWRSNAITIKHNFIEENSCGVYAFESHSTTLLNNTIAGNNSNGVTVNGGTCTIMNNIISHNGGIDIESEGAATLDISYNDVYINGTDYAPSYIKSQTDISVDPCFNNMKKHDFFLKLDSPLRNKGKNGTYIGAFPPGVEF